MSNQQFKPSGEMTDVDRQIVGRAQQELDKIRGLVEAGALPRTRLKMAELALEDAQDEAVLRQSLYGKLSVNETSRDEVQSMVNAARRLYERQKLRLDEAEILVNQGVTARTMLTPILEDLDSRRKTVDLAESRARLWDQLAAMAKAETASDDDGPDSFSGIKHRFDGKGSFTDREFRNIEAAFQAKFHKPLPISALGETNLHKSLGFDHRGRVDVAVSPDQQEGVWLRAYLESHQIPYFAFRAAVAGSATGPHIHMGPPSTRYYAVSELMRTGSKAHIVNAKAKTPKKPTAAVLVAD